MAKKKAKKGSSKQKKAIRRPVTGKNQHRTVSFLIGVVTVAVIGLAIFLYSQNNNYKQILTTPSYNQSLFSK